MEPQSEQNKAIVLRYNKEVIEEGNLDSFRELVDENFINHAAPPGENNGPEGMINRINKVMRPAFPDLRVEILDQIAEGDKVTTRKHIYGTHTGEFMGIPATNKKRMIEIIDIVRLHNGKYVEHWAVNTLPSLISQLKFERISQSLYTKAAVRTA